MGNVLKINSLLAAGCMSVMQEFAKSFLFSQWDLWLDFISRSYARSLCRRNVCKCLFYIKIKKSRCCAWFCSFFLGPAMNKFFWRWKGQSFLFHLTYILFYFPWNPGYWSGRSNYAAYVFESGHIKIFEQAFFGAWAWKKMWAVAPTVSMVGHVILT